MPSRRPIPVRSPPVGKQASKQLPEVAQLLQAGLELHRKGRIDDAKLIYERILQKQSDHFDAIQLLATVYAQQKQPDLALKYFDKALRINKTNSAILNNRGITLKDLNRLDEALQSYEEALRIKPDYADAYYNRGNVLQELRRLDEALKSYEEALRIKPDYAEAHNNRGIALKDLKRLDEALQSYEEALRIKPDYADAYYNRGNALRDLKRLDEALKSYEEALRIKPDYADAHNNRGNTLHDLKRLDEALKSYEKALQLRPNYAEAYYNRGNALRDLKRLDDALKSYEEALRIKPDYAEAFNNRGNTLRDLKRLDEALKSYEEALRIQPDYAEAYTNQGNAFRDLKRLDEALKSYEEALRIKPDYADAHNNRGNVLKEVKRLDEALKSYEEALRIKPDYAEVLNNRGNALQDLNRLDEALAAYEEALRIKPDHAEAYYNRGNTLRDLKLLDEALKSYGEALRVKPDYAEARNNRALLKLMLKDFIGGFLDYTCRWNTEDFPSVPQKTTLPSCSENGLKGRILFWAEQGIGDEIFYAGLLPLLSKQDISITLSADKRLHPIYKRSFPNIEMVDKEVLLNSSLETGFDAQSPIGDLGYLLNLDEAAIKATRSPYLKSDAARRDDIRKAIGQFGSKMVCGIAWKSANKKLEAEKSIDLSSFEGLLCLRSVKFVNLQYGDVEDETQKIKSKLSVDIHQVPGIDIFQDLDGLLALIDACDLVVTTSNVTAHIAGALGKPGAVLVPYGKGKIWYWHHNDENSFWYPSLRLFYQDEPHSWESAIKNCSDWVRSLMPSRRATPLRSPPVAKQASKELPEVAQLLQAGLELHQKGRIDDAKLIYERILQKQSDHFDAIQLLATVYVQQKQPELALKYFDKAIQIDRKNAAIFNNRGLALQDLKLFEEALESYEEALSIKPDYAKAYNNKGNALKKLRRFDDALNSYAKAIGTDPEYAEAYYNLGNTLQEINRFDESIKCYKRGLGIRPDYTDAHYNCAILKLKLKDFIGGFSDYMHRWDSKEFPSKSQKTTLPHCRETGLKGRVLLWGEQGIGDEVFYAGLLPPLTKKEVSITISADKRLHSIYERSFPTLEFVDKDALMASSLDAGFDSQAPMADLGHLLGLDAEIIKATRLPFLKSDVRRRDDISRKISALGSQRTCGIAWKSSNQEFGSDKSIDLNSFEDLLCLPGIDFINLQYGEVKKEIDNVKSKLSVDIIQVPDVDLFQDLDGLLALIDACDFVVTTSNVTAHLAGALGKPGAVLVPYGRARFWYWHHNDENSFWYPNLRLFYQDETHSWKSAIKSCSDWVKSL